MPGLPFYQFLNPAQAVEKANLIIFTQIKYSSLISHRNQDQNIYSKINSVKNLLRSYTHCSDPSSIESSESTKNRKERVSFTGLVSYQYL